MTHSAYLRGRYGKSVYRVAVDGGFSCPNRADRGSPGCAFCAVDAGRAPYLDAADPVAEQVGKAVGFLRRRYGAQSFLLYFQAFSGTNAPAAALKVMYDAALGLAPFLELIVATRPDCIDEARAELLSSYRDRGLDVWVELGLQTANDQTLSRMDRGHTAADFTAAYRLLKKKGVKVAVHLIFGLPGEGAPEIEASARFVAGLCPDGVKLHNLHIPRGTRLAAEYSKGEITAPGPAWHRERVIRALELLPASTVIMRVTTDTPADLLIAPRGFWDKRTFAHSLAGEMRRRGTWQGRLHDAHVPAGSLP
jgi:uncharacterized protein